MSLEEYNQMFESQKGLCYLCGNTSPSTKMLSVDHCHVSGSVRSLLCKSCNTGLGCFKEDISLMLKAIQYLNDHRNKTVYLTEDSKS